MAIGIKGAEFFFFKDEWFVSNIDRRQNIQLKQPSGGITNSLALGVDESKWLGTDKFPYKSVPIPSQMDAPYWTPPEAYYDSWGTGHTSVLYTVQNYLTTFLRGNVLYSGSGMGKLKYC